MRFLATAIFALLMIIASGRSFAQSVIPVFLETTVEEADSAGLQLVYEIKEAIRRSSGFRLVEDVQKWPYIRYSLVTLKGNNQTVVSHTFTYDSVEIPLGGAHIVSSVQFCGNSVVQGCARTIMGHLDEAVNQLKRKAPKLWQALK